MASASLANLGNIYKTLYAGGCPDSAFTKNTLLGRLRKKTDFGGDTYALSGRFTNASGVSATFANAQANSGASGYNRFSLTRDRDYAIIQIDNEAMEASQNKGGAVVDALKEETDSAFAEAAHRINVALYGNRGGSFAQIAAVSTTTITVTNPLDLVKVERNQYVQSSITDGTSGAVVADATQITAIDREAGTIEAAANWAATFDVGDYLFVHGDFGAKIAGVPGWLPTSVGGSDSWFGQNRSYDRQRLAGYMMSATAAHGTLEVALKAAATRSSIHGGNAGEVYLNPIQWDQLDNELGSRARYERLAGQASGNKDMAKVGFKAITIVTPNGDLNVLADRDCPQHVAYGLDMAECCFATLNAAPRILTYGDGKTLRLGSSDGLEMRIGWYGQFGIRTPGKCFRLDTTAVTA